MWQSIADQISTTLQQPFVIRHRDPLVNEPTLRRVMIQDGERSFFVKVAPRAALEQLESEQKGLASLAARKQVRVPNTLCCGTTAEHGFLVMEYLALHEGDSAAWLRLGADVARLHQATEQAMYGWDEDNFYNGIPQPNQWQRNWATFFAEQRIGWQLQLLAERGIQLVDIDDMVTAVARLLAHHQPTPSLLHGNLWRGNLGFCDGEGVLYDPSCYYGDREVDIAMSELFGSLPAAFYQGYNDVWPLDDAYQIRKEIYNLYPLLNQLFQFGEGYHHQVTLKLQHVLAL